MIATEATRSIEDEATLQLGADVLNLDGVPGIDEHFANYGISQDRLKLAAPDAIVLHPGPMNRGIEIDSAVAGGPQSVITQQVTNGVAVRMAVLERVGRIMSSQ
jgi:aspartate carbamoyltransferase catalytic subunit